MSVLTENQHKSYQRTITILSIAIPVAVAVLLGIPQKVYLGEWTKNLPALNACINSLTTILLLAGLAAIKQKNIRMHRFMMATAVGLGALFLVSYVIYHLTNAHTVFPKENPLRPVYLFLLITHIILSIVVVRFVLMALYYALTDQIDRHKKIVKWAYPIWLYVSVTGVIVYMLISPYYQ